MNLTGLFTGKSSRTVLKSIPSTSKSNPSKRKRSTSRRSSRLASSEVDESGQSTGKQKRKNSTSSNDDLQTIFMENLFNQRENHTLQNDVLKLQKQKLEAKMDIDIEASKVELERKKLDLETSRELAKIEVNKQQRLAEMEIKKMQDSLKK